MVTGPTDDSRLAGGPVGAALGLRQRPALRGERMFCPARAVGRAGVRRGQSRQWLGRV